MQEITRELDPIFYPKAIAVVGATPNFYKWGSFLLSNLMKWGFKGDIYPVNPKETLIFGKKCYPSLLDTPDPVDLVIIAIPAAYCKAAVSECIEKGVKGILLITSGFSEVGPEGAALEKEIVAMVRKAGIRLIGPNTMGIINSHHDVTVTGSHIRPVPGHISLISQSGNMGSQVLGWAESMGIGIDKFIGSGNEGDVNVTDLISYLADDKTTHVILLYMEGIGDGRRFLDVVSKVSLQKPIIALKGGRTQAGSKAALSHTGSLAGSYEVTKGALKQAGVIIANNPAELIDFSVAFEHMPLPEGNRVAVFTIGGGWGVVASDECNERGFVLPELPTHIIKELDKLLPSFWSRGNPLDIVGQFNPVLFNKAIDLLAQSDSFDAIIDLGGLGASHFIYRVISTARDVDPGFDNQIVQIAISEAAKLEAGHLRDIGNLTKKFGKPIVTVSHAEKLQYAIPIDDMMIVAYPTPEKAIRVLEMMLWYRNWKNRRK